MARPAKARPGIDSPGLGCGLAILRDDRILLCRRLKAPAAGHWTITGGKIDFMEASADAARREAEEESGLSVGAIDFLCLSEQRIAADHQHWVSIIYVTRDAKGEPQITEPDKLTDTAFFPLDALPAPLSVFAEDAIRAIRARGF